MLEALFCSPLLVRGAYLEQSVKSAFFVQEVVQNIASLGYSVQKLWGNTTCNTYTQDWRKDLCYD